MLVAMLIPAHVETRHRRAPESDYHDLETPEGLLDYLERGLDA